MPELSIIIISLFVIIVAVISDLKTLEVPDWINYAGIAAGLGVHIIISLQEWSAWPFASSAIGLGIGFALASIMFYTGQWGGGDAKLLIALGALIGFEPDMFGFGFGFIVNLIICGAIWGLLWSIGIAIKNSRKVWRTFKALRTKKRYMQLRAMSIISTTAILIAAFIITKFEIELFALAVLTFSMGHLTILTKSIELSAMHKWVTPDKLTEGDWLVNEIKVGKVHVKPPKLGLEKEHVKKLQKLYKQGKIKKVCVKYGVPFTPSFLLAFIATLAWGNVMLAVLF